MENLNTYSKPMVNRRINLALDDVEFIRKRLKNSVLESHIFGELLTNIEIALDLQSDESDYWEFRADGSRSHLNNQPLNN